MKPLATQSMPTSGAACAGDTTRDALSNPLLAAWTAPHGMPPFAQIRAEHFEPALREAMRLHRAELAAIGRQPAAPEFDNTAAAFDRSGALLDRIQAVFYNLAASATSDDLQAVQRTLAAPLAAHRNAVYMDAALFARLDVLHARRATLGLAPEALRLLERLHLDFVRSGALLTGAAQQSFAAVMEELAALTTRFAQNVLHDESSWTLPLLDAAACAGLPPFVLDAARQAAAERGHSGAVITLSRSLVVPFLTYSTRRDLRELAWRAWVGRGEHAGEHDNREVARAILRLRREQAALLGYASYADYALADTMAGTRAAVAGLLDEVWPRALAAVRREEAELDEVRHEAAASGVAGDASDARNERDASDAGATGPIEIEHQRDVAQLATSEHVQDALRSEFQHDAAVGRRALDRRDRLRLVV